MTLKEYKELLKTNKNMKEKKGKKSKYNNKITVVDGITFQSAKEANKYPELKILERIGEIKDLELQVPFEVVPALHEPDTIGKRGGIKKGKTIERAVEYIADFVYFDCKKQQKVIIDTKGFRTKDYVIKRKLMKQLYKDFEFIES